MAILERTLKNGQRRWYAIFQDQHGKQRWEVAGTTARQARTLEQKRRGEVIDGTYKPRRERRREVKAAAAAAEAAKGPTFADFGERFVRDYAAAACRSDFHAERVALFCRREPFRSKRLGEITAADLQAYLARRMETSDGWRKAAATTATKELAVLRVLFKCAVRWGVIAANPCATVTPPKRTAAKPPRWLTRDEYGRLSEAADSWLRPLLAVAVLTGARLGEAVALRWEHIDRENGIVNIPAGKTIGRAVPLTDALAATLDAIPRRLRCPFVFSTPAGEPLTDEKARSRVSTATRDAAHRARLPGVSFHALRHTAASWLAQGGIPLYEVGAILGHSTPAMTQRYAHLAPGYLKGAAAVMERAFAPAPGTETLEPALDSASGAGSGSGAPTRPRR